MSAKASQAPRPCPCCGSRAELTFSPNRLKVGVGCTKCLLGQIPSFDTVETAIEAWDARDEDAVIAGLADRIAYVIEFNGCGFWRTCTGCYESEDGYPNGHYPTSKVLGCTLGAGCSECGGIGATFDSIDYEDMARDMGRTAALEERARAGGEEADVAAREYLADDWMPEFVRTYIGKLEALREASV